RLEIKDKLVNRLIIESIRVWGCNGIGGMRNGMVVEVRVMEWERMMMGEEEGVEVVIREEERGVVWMNLREKA
ncbi:hypothetical protein, partial [Paenibacillus xylanexedens]|uniref:hypothetical protein n=1 Tax=Paenibacillus xylanexedens TaxID=528191 RepID=UPI0016424AE2